MRTSAGSCISVSALAELGMKPGPVAHYNRLSVYCEALGRTAHGPFPCVMWMEIHSIGVTRRALHWAKSLNGKITF